MEVYVLYVFFSCYGTNANERHTITTHENTYTALGAFVCLSSIPLARVIIVINFWASMHNHQLADM